MFWKKNKTKQPLLLIQCIQDETNKYHVIIYSIAFRDHQFYYFNSVWQLRVQTVTARVWINVTVFPALI